MILKEIKSNNKGDVLALLGDFLDSPETLYASMNYRDGDYIVAIIRPTNTASDSTNDASSPP